MNDITRPTCCPKCGGRMQIRLRSLHSALLRCAACGEHGARSEEIVGLDQTGLEAPIRAA